MSMVMPRRFSSSRRSASMPVRAFTSEVFPWSICPAVPTMTDFICDSIDARVGRTLLSAAVGLGFDLGADFDLDLDSSISKQNQRQKQRTRVSALHEPWNRSLFFSNSTNPDAKTWLRCDNKDSPMTTSAIIAITPEVIREHGLTPEEFEKIKQLLGGREPTRTELGIFSVMWSEHCSYKSSRVHLKRLPTRSKLVLQGPGENAGIVDIGDGWACAFKIESHNHPSFIEPFQGAATGVGGILRDIFTMGARPVAVMDAIRFGPLDSEKTGARNRRVLSGVVSGIAHYGNCFGVPTIGGE